MHCYLYTAQTVSQVALLGIDYPGMRPRFKVKEDEHVKLGQPLFYDKKNEAVQYTAPGSGKIVSINRGERRRFLSIIIELDGEEEQRFKTYSISQLKHLSQQEVTEQLIRSGLWASIRQRPFSKVPDPKESPHSIFITAMDSNPLAPSVVRILAGQTESFTTGLQVLAHLTEGKLHLCQAPHTEIHQIKLANLELHQFRGPHPSGNVGTHIHFIDPVNRDKQVWYIAAQDVCAIGKLFTTGRLNIERIIALVGPQVKQPRLLKTRIGAALPELVNNELKGDSSRIISGSVLCGHDAREPVQFLGRYHQQVSVLKEGGKRQFLGWLRPGWDQFSVKNVVFSKLKSRKKFDFTTDQKGSLRAIVPVGSYESVMPMDILPTFLLKALAVQDVEQGEQLGCLELDEEDLALCTFVCPSKIKHGHNLRKTLNLIEKEGL